MSIKATFPAGVTDITVNGLHQWDYGQKVEIHADDLPALIEVHFACADMHDAVVRVCSVIDGKAEAAIPDHCLEQTSPILAWIYLVGETTGATVKTIILPVVARTQPQPSPTLPEDISDKYTEAVAAMTELVEAVETAVANTAEAVLEDVKESIASGALPVSHASTAGFAVTADEADTAQTARYAEEAGKADFAKDADYAENAGWAEIAGDAETALTASRATSDKNGNDIAETYTQRASCRPQYTYHAGIALPTIVGDQRVIGNLPEGYTLDDISFLMVELEIFSTKEKIGLTAVREYIVNHSETPGQSNVDFTCTSTGVTVPRGGDQLSQPALLFASVHVRLHEQDGNVLIVFDDEKDSGLVKLSAAVGHSDTSFTEAMNLFEKCLLVSTTFGFI